MTTITLDDQLIEEVISVSHCQNAQEAIISVVMGYLKQHQKTKQPLFEQLHLISDFSDDEIDLLFQRDSDTGREIEL